MFCFFIFSSLTFSLILELPIIETVRMDLEERRRQLAELKAAREAKQRQMERIAQANIVADAPAPTAHASPVRSTATEVALSSSPLSSKTPLVEVVGNVGVVDIPPSRPETYDRDVETDHCYVYSECRPDPKDVVPTEEVAILKQMIQDLREGEGGTAFNETKRNSALPVALSFWDKTASVAAGKTIRSPPFLDFVARCVAATRRTLHAGGSETGLESDPSFLMSENATALHSSVSSKLHKRAVLFDPAVCRGRIVTSMAFLPKSADQFVCAFSASDSGLGGGPRGLVLLFSTRRPTSAPLKFVCDDEVRVVTFSPFHENLIIGGCTSGRIVCWHMLKGSDPVVSSFPSPDGHSSAIVSLAVRGDGSSNQLLSVCQEGHWCSWQTDNPRRPAQSRHSTLVGSEKTGRMFSAASFVTSRGDITDAAKVVCGGVDGCVYETVARGARAAEVRKRSEDKKHEGSITTVDCHPHHSDPRIAELVLTSSTDATCRLWCGASCVSLETFTDVPHHLKWNPVNPAIFASADASGKLCVWNLSESCVAPVASASVGGIDTSAAQDSTNSTSSTAAALRLQWDDSGEHLLCGTSSGEVHYYEVSSVAPSADGARALSDWISHVFAS